MRKKTEVFHLQSFVQQNQKRAPVFKCMFSIVMFAVVLSENKQVNITTRVNSNFVSRVFDFYMKM